MSIFKALRKDHETQRSLLKELINTEDNGEKRIQVFKKLRNELETHTDAEERCFYKPLIENKDTQEKASHVVAEHHEIDELVEALENTNSTASNWLEIAQNLKRKIEHHFDEEEQEIFQMAGVIFTDNTKEVLAKEYNRYMSRNR